MKCETMMLYLLFFLTQWAPNQARTRFRFAMTILGRATDFGYTFHQNLGRINLQRHLTENFPNMVTEHTFAPVPMSYTEDCDPQFTAWIKEGYDLIIGVIGHQWCLAKLAMSYPNVSFVATSGSIPGPSNYANLWVRMYQSTYLAGYTAGLVTKSKKVCISAGLRVPAPVMDVSAFCRGVHNSDPTIQIHLMETREIDNALLEVWIVNQSYALGCDTVFLSSMSIDGCVQANKLGMKCVGFLTDARLIIGESVITSSYIDFTPMFVRAAETVLNGTLATEAQRPDWWMGWEWGGAILAQPSFLVPAAAAARVQAEVANLSRVFCGRVCTGAGCLCDASACCLTDFQLNTMVTYPDFVIEHGLMKVPGQACSSGQLATWHLDTFTMQCTDCPPGTYAYNYNEISECRRCPAGRYSSVGATACAACPAGTYSDQPGQGQCLPCPGGTIAANPEAAKCNICPSGLSSSDGTQCGSAPLVWLAGVGGGIAAAFLLFGVWAWRASRNMRRLRKQFSNDNVAVECAAAIARLDLQAVAWLHTIPKPNCIQLSFIRIVKILDEVAKYVPDQLLQTLGSATENTEADEGDGVGLVAVMEAGDGLRGERSQPEDVRSASSEKSRSISHRRPTLIPPATATGLPVPCALSCRPSLASSKNQGKLGLFSVRRVTYLLVQFHMNQHQCPANQAESNLNAFLGHLVDTAKAQGGTLGAVAYDHAVIHWGTGKAVAEAPVRAVETALCLAGFGGRLAGGARLHLNVAVGHGSATTGAVETATNHFFVLGGGQIPIVQRIAVNDWNAAIGVPVLITEAVKASAQYAFLCHPRLVEGGEVLWEPVARLKEKGADEWMYQLREGEGAVSLTPAILLGPFMAVLGGDLAEAAALIQAIREKHSNDLRAADLASLEWLLSSNSAYPALPPLVHGPRLARQ